MPTEAINDDGSQIRVLNLPTETDGSTTVGYGKRAIEQEEAHIDDAPVPETSNFPENFSPEHIIHYEAVEEAEVLVSPDF